MSIQKLTPMSNDRRDVYGSDAPIQPEYHREKMRAERIANGLDPDTGRFPDSTANILDATLDKLDIPGARVLKILPPPSDNVAVHTMQMQESRNSDRVAEMIADVAFKATHLSDLNRAEYAACRCLATHALRKLSLGWVKAAQQAAVDAGVLALKDQGFGHLADAHLDAVSRAVTGHVLAAYLGVTEGTTSLTPGAYLRIVRGEQ